MGTQKACLSCDNSDQNLASFIQDRQKKYTKEASLIYMLITYLNDIANLFRSPGEAQQGSDEMVGECFCGKH